MESALSPREIQTRIRAGESLEDVTRAAGIEPERVERFAAPVLAEREYVAGQAMAASVRRRGETSGHRNLRSTLTERLTGRGVDLQSLRWDAYRLPDGRWAVTADYGSGDTARQAVFLYDAGGRFSVAGNEEARWVLSEQPPARGSRPARRPPEGQAEPSEEDVEPTLDLSDELAIVRAVQEPPAGPPAAAQDERLASVQPLRRVPEPAPVPEPPAEDVEAGSRAAAAETGPASQLDALYEMLGGSDHAEDSTRVYPGLSDASAVPEGAAGGGAGWEPAIVVNYPVEPSQVDDAEAEARPGTDEPGPPDPPTAIEDRADEAEALEEEQEAAPDHPPAAGPPAGPAEEESAPARRGGRRKRASVPSWDEIMFGSPKRP